MIGREPREIWQDSLEDGQRRLARSAPVLAATGLLGGFHVTLGLLALVVSTGALTAVMPETTAHVLGSLTFGIGFVFVTVGRSELFTENFLIPVAAALKGHCAKSSVARLWAITFVLNLVGIALFVSLASIPGVLERDALQAAGNLADTLAERDLPAAAASAVLAGAVITTFTWLAEAAESDLTRVFIALGIGFVLLAPSTNHSVVGFGEILFGIVADTTSADWIDLLRNTAIALVGNVAGGVILVAFVRGVQAGAE
ncbi:MAG: formate/nitrite transporter family protein [Solirubrobacterales bacterium]|nr:formate/nitrite transporter family protein [Solirubrobacterales bacterium]